MPYCTLPTLQITLTERVCLGSGPIVMTQMKYLIVLCRAEQESEPGKVLWATNETQVLAYPIGMCMYGTLNAVSSEG